VKLGIDATELREGAVGGVRTAVWLLLDALRNYAPDVELQAIAPEPVETPRGVRCVATGGPRRPLLWRRSRQLRRHLKDLDLFHSPVTAFPDAPLPLTATVHELPFVENSRLEGQWRALVQEYWLSRAMSRCRALVAPTQATLLQLGIAHPAAPRITRVVPHPAPPVERAAHGHDGSLLFVGRLQSRKRVDLLLEACASLAVPVELWIVGDGPARPELESLARRVFPAARFHGDQRGPALEELFDQADLFVLPSRSESFPNALLEAMAAGLPAVASAVGGVLELVDHGRTGLLVPPGDAGALAGALSRLLTEPALSRAIGRAARAHVEVTYSFERMVAGFESLYQVQLDRHIARRRSHSTLRSLTAHRQDF